MSKDVNNDYKTMLQVAQKYSNDAQYVDKLVTEFSSTSQELLESISDILKAIEGVATLSSVGAKGTVDITSKVLEINTRSNDVLNLVDKANNISEKLRNAVSKFKV